MENPMFDRQRIPPTIESPKPVLKPIEVGSVVIPVPVLLAPMAGVTDEPFRRLVKKHGAGLMFSEMIASQAMVRAVRRTLRMASMRDGDRLVGVQLAGCEPRTMAEAAKLNEDLGAPLIDINFGCPAKKIVNNEAGSALMRDETRAAKILEAVVGAVKIPVTLKMRMGWDHEHLNAPRLAKIAEDCGIRMITVHGRTRSQFYGGVADWGFIRQVKEAVRVPIIANGDIVDVRDAARALEFSGADGVMIGRGSLGRPWFLRDVMDFLDKGILPFPVSTETRRAAALEHFETMLAYYGEEAGLRIARKHMGWYSKGISRASEFRAAVNHDADAASVRQRLNEFFA